MEGSRQDLQRADGDPHTPHHCREEIKEISPLIYNKENEVETVFEKMCSNCGCFLDDTNADRVSTVCKTCAKVISRAGREG